MSLRGESVMIRFGPVRLGVSRYVGRVKICCVKFRSVGHG